MTRTNTKVVIENFVVGNHNYIITIDNENEYWGFDKSNPKKEYNGINGNHGKTLNETLAHCYCEARSKDELNQELIQNNDINELMKLMKIVEEANKMYPHNI